MGAVILCLAYMLAAAVILQAGAQPTGNVCPPGKSSCVCQSPDGVIDLTALSKHGSPKFTDVVDPFSFSYNYNPCSTFSEGSSCSDVYVCQTSSDIPPNSYPIADKGTEKIYIDDNDIYMYYSSPTGDGNLREVKVHLMCDQSLTNGKETITTEGDSVVTLLYEFTLTSCHACPKGCPGGGGSGGSVSGYIGLIIIFLKKRKNKRYRDGHHPVGVQNTNFYEIDGDGQEKDNPIVELNETATYATIKKPSAGTETSASMKSKLEFSEDPHTDEEDEPLKLNLAARQQVEDEGDDVDEKTKVDLGDDNNADDDEIVYL